MPKNALPADFVDAMTAPTVDTGKIVKTAKPVHTRKATKVATPAKARKVGVAFRLDSALLERARATAYWLSGPPECLHLVDLVERGLRRELQALERKHNDGKPFASRKK